MKLRTAALVACLATLLTLACSAKTRHKALTVFFDGVPPAEADSAPGEAEGAAAAGTAPAQRAVIYEHEPYAAGSCESCHDRDAANALPADKLELCLGCHELRADQLDGDFVHAPVALGECLLCHDPHSSSHRSLLLEEPPALCLGCHDRGQLEEGGHDDLQVDCRECHDAHGSGAEYLLK